MHGVSVPVAHDAVQSGVSGWLLCVFARRCACRVFSTLMQTVVRRIMVGHVQITAWPVNFGRAALAT